MSAFLHAPWRLPGSCWANAGTIPPVLAACGTAAPGPHVLSAIVRSWYLAIGRVALAEPAAFGRSPYRISHPVQRHLLSPLELFGSAWRHRILIRNLVEREVVGRYQGSVLGVLWSFFNPVLMLAIYTFVFSVVFKARWTGGGGSKVEFALLLFIGLMLFNLFAECVNRAPTLVLNHANYVKKVVFPLEILPWAGLGSALFHALASLMVWLAAHAVLVGPPPATALLLPLVVLPLLLLTLGLSWALASLGVYLRDVSQVVGLATTGLMFMSPVFYPVSALPQAFHVVFRLNPLVPVIEQARDVLFWGRGIDLPTYAASLALSSVVAWLGFAWFQKTRAGFADVL